MVMVSGLSLMLPPDIALAALILPVLVSNLMQTLRGGAEGLWPLIVRFRFYLATLVVVLLAATQLVTVISDRAFFLVIGLPVTLFSLVQLAGWQLRLRRQSRWTDFGVGAISGFFGGLSGVWGPPTVAYLTALDLAKAQHVRVQGIIYFSGSVMLMVGHLRSGIVNAQTFPLSVALLIPAVIGMLAGGKFQDRIDQKTFRRATLIVLLVAGVNLLRRAVF